MNLREREAYRHPEPRKKLTDAERKALPRVNIPPKQISAKHSAKLLQRKYIETLEQDQKLNLCCRHVEEAGHEAQWFATPSAEKTDKGETIPDILFIWCGECGRRHTRFFVGSGDRVVVKENG